MLGKTQSEAEFVGDVGDGASRVLEAFLRQHPTVRVLHLNSPGGLANEGLRLAELVRSRKLSVVIDSSCQSACTDVLLAGAERWARPTAKIGFHQGRPLGNVAKDVDCRDDDLAAALARVGASSAFIDRALQTPNSEIYSPSIEELLTEHVLTGAAKDDQFIYSTPGTDRPDIEGLLTTGDPFLAAMRDVDPPTFARVADEYEHAGEKGETLAALAEAVSSLKSKEWHALACTGSTDAAHARLSSQQHLIAAVAEHFPERCKGWLRGDREVDGLPSALLDEQNEALALALRKSGAYPPVRDTREDLDRATALLMKALSARTRITIRTVILGTSSDDRAACSAAVEYFEKLASLAPEQMSLLIRGEGCMDAEPTRR
jgi:hypothetical protein